jgi:serine/threonine-protein kinase
MFPAEQLSDDLRRKVDCADRDYVVTRPRSRTSSKVLDAGSAELLAQFKEPKQIIDAVVAFSAATGQDPEATLEEFYPLLRELIEGGFLVASDSELAEVIKASLQEGDAVGSFSISKIVQVLEDTELYRAEIGNGSAVAIKLARPGYERRINGVLRREGAVLDELDGRVNPRLVERGELSGRPYIAMEWCPGERATSVAARIRRFRGAQSRELLGVCINVAEAYAHLHDQGVIHGDVHPGNLLLLPDLSVKIIDFGFASN